MKVLFLHGFNSSGETEKSKILSKYYDVISPNLPTSPIEAIQLIKKTIIDLIISGEKVIVVGSSLGGFYGLYFLKKMDIPVLLLNLSETPYITLKREIGNNINGVTWNETHLDELKEIADEVKNTEYYSVLLNIFVSKNDEIIDHSNIEKSFPYSNIEYFDDDHSFSNFEKTLPNIKKIIDKYKKFNYESLVTT